MGELLTRAYLAGVPTSRAIWTHIAAALDQYHHPPSHQVVLELLDATVTHPLATWAPRDPSHTCEVLGWLAGQWQERGWPVPKEFCPEVVPSDPTTPELFYKTYQGLIGGENVTLLESGGGIAHNTTGLTSWCGSAVLAEWAINNPGVVDGRRVLELGAGVGLAACVLMTAPTPPLAYTASDCHHHVLALLHHNLALNLTTQRPSREQLEAFQRQMSEEVGRDEVEAGQVEDWQPHQGNGSAINILDPPEHDNTSDTAASISMVDVGGCGRGEVGVMQVDWRCPPRLPPVDVVLAADVVYDRPLIPPLVSLIRSILDGSAWEQEPPDAVTTTLTKEATEASKIYPNGLEKENHRERIPESDNTVRTFDKDNDSNIKFDKKEHITVSDKRVSECDKDSDNIWSDKKENTIVNDNRVKTFDKDNDSNIKFDKKEHITANGNRIRLSDKDDDGIWSDKKENLTVNDNKVKTFDKDNDNDVWSVINDCEEQIGGEINHSEQELKIYTMSNETQDSGKQIIKETETQGQRKREAYLACTRRSQETLSVFLSEVAKQGMVAKLVYQNCLSTETALFVYNETHLPVKVYRVTL